MLRDAAAEIVFREYEANVLDVHHQTFPLASRDRQIAIYAMLAQHDMLAITDVVAGIQKPDMLHAQLYKSTEEGLSQGIRWIFDRPVDLEPTSDPAIISEANAYASFAGTYVDLADMHKLYGRGQVSVEVDEASRRVKFSYRNISPMSLEGYVESAHRAQIHSSSKTKSQYLKLFQALEKAARSMPHHCDSGRLIFDDISRLNDSVFDDCASIISPPEDLLLAGGTDLHGFSVDDFERYFKALRRWSFFATFMFVLMVTQDGRQQCECNPTQVILRTTFIDNMSVLTGLPEAVIEEITRRLTYDCRTSSPDIFQQPLICGDNYVSWSVRVVERSRHLRNLLRLMVRTPAMRNHAATVVGSRDRAMLKDLGSILSQRGGMSYKIMTDIQGGGERGDIDLLAYNSKFPDDVLVIEGKAILGVDEINEIDSATTEMQRAQDQLEKVIRILNGMSTDEKRQLYKFVRWESVKTLYGMVVAQDAEPNEKYDQSRIPGISLLTIKARMRDNHLSNPKSLWTRCKNRPWLSDLIDGINSHKAIKVGDVTYFVPVYMR
jgi:hypothetical protein